MLLPVRAGLAPSAVFRGLNALVREALLASCSGRTIDESTLPYGLWNAAQANLATDACFQALAVAIRALDDEGRLQLYLGVRTASSVRQLFTDPIAATQEIPEAVNVELRNLTTHLFKSSSTLAGITQACGETVMDHYNRYSAIHPPGNGNVCGICATEYLAQRRGRIAANEQWRAPYDHLLAKEKYPQFGIDPDNLMPICNTCNSKAKLAKDLLHNLAGQRRMCFDPWTENFQGQVNLNIDLQDISPGVTWSMSPQPLTNQSKLATWDEVYRIKERIEGEFSSVEVKLAEDLDCTDLAAFKHSLTAKAHARKQFERRTPFNYWRHLLYRSLLRMADTDLEQLRTLCHATLDPNGDAETTYGI
ncbi:HNH endonuclease [Pseudomonas sp. IT-196MI5]|uniref:hypothetical protein n=1 Tax=Pseudomonas sp. IT-196MI5 TaxID=3026440 RepID=UPI0039E046AE